MSQLNVDTIGSQTGTTISIASGHTLSVGVQQIQESNTSGTTITSTLLDEYQVHQYRNTY